MSSEVAPEMNATVRPSGEMATPWRYAWVSLSPSGRTSSKRSVGEATGRAGGLRVHTAAATSGSRTQGATSLQAGTRGMVAASSNANGASIHS